MSKVRRAVLYSFANQYSLLFISFVEVMIIARLLAPGEIGVFAVAAAGLMIATELRSLGITPYLVRDTNLTDDKLRTANTVITTMSWSLALAMILGSSLAAEFYREPGLEPVLEVTGFSFLFVPFTAAPFALLVRQMDFKTTLRIHVVVTLVRVTTTLTLAFLGFSYMSMAWGLLASAVAEVLVVTHYRPPGVPYGLGVRHLREMLSFGIYTSASGLMRRASEVLPDLVIGRLTNVASVAIFSRGQGLVQIFNMVVVQAVRPVILPLLSSENRAGIDLKVSYLKAVSMQTGVGWPFFVWVALFAYPIMRILYGDQWDAAVPIAKILCIWGAIQLLYNFGNEVLTAAGLVRLVTLKEAIMLALRLTALLIVVPHGFQAVAGVLAALAGVEFVIVSVILSRQLSIRLHELLLTLKSSAGVAICSAVPPLVVVNMMQLGPENLFIPLITAGPLCALAWLVGVILFRHPIYEELQRYLKQWLRPRS